MARRCRPAVAATTFVSSHPIATDLLAASVIAIVCWAQQAIAAGPPNTSSAYSQQCFYTNLPRDPYATPVVTPLDLPRLPQTDAIWGGTGRDNRGHIWFGVCGHTTRTPSAYLVEYVPDKGELVPRGDAVSALKECGVYRPGEIQAKIHTRIFQMEDGHLYFASMDVHALSLEGATGPPTWGSHLWRLRLPENKWEHLKAVPEALMAASGNGRRFYAIGYPGHVMYQYDIATGELRSVKVGALAGHISRNFVSDMRDHVYVPRLRRSRETDELLIGLVEFDENLNEVHETPLKHYFDRTPANSHGLTAYQPMADGSIVICTSLGFLYRIAPAENGPAVVSEIGWLHPDGPKYVASLFTYDGENHVIGLATTDKDREYNRDYEWVVYDMKARRGRALPFTIGSRMAPPASALLLYGSVARDNAGRFYVVGSHYPARKPMALQVQCPE